MEKSLRTSRIESGTAMHHCMHLAQHVGRLLREKEDSTLYKTKVRLRWYEDPDEGPMGQSFLEVKSRVGQRRAKWRQPVELAAADLSTMSLTDHRLLAPLALLEEDPTVSILGLTPILVVRYHRRRWNDPLTGARISLDYEISAPRSNPRLLATTRAGSIPQVILEIKNRSGEIPPNLPFLSALGAASCSFSKYFECHQVLAGAEIKVA